MSDTTSKTPSCSNCDREDEWGCTPMEKNPEIQALGDKYGNLRNGYQLIAAECPSYTYIEPDNEGPSEDDLMTAAEKAKLEAHLQDSAETEDLRYCEEKGWYNPITKEFNDEYYQLGDQAYGINHSR